ncbi:hypothetical protein VCUG_02388 [Vavraia culicis subsp. floridensis]|uniref:USP domain-containing protein n=1 Tax=Vavraia culicis (isolate floridensis) TaxID=948595 RepID=L2GSQ2_VAVCU|nr:uncharacterized protein VCUG_02388 [Vavraia culicis subsp. floridensis]ELA46125.1 hypothetical protein VCUG_02388 [Vavraia culicis subsp. floridensis]
MSKRRTLFTIVFLVLLFLIPMYFLRRRTAIVCGLRNHHNVCYINSVLQSLFSCESFTAMLESLEPKNNTVMYHIKNLWNDMKDNDSLNRLELYSKLATMSDSLFKYDNKPGFTENFVEFIAINLEKEIETDIFLDEENFKKNKSESFFLKKSARHIILVSKKHINKDSYLESIQNFVEDNDFLLPKILIISAEPVYRNKQILEPSEKLVLKNKTYELRAIILRKRKKNNKGHFYTMGKRNNSWFEFNDEKLRSLHDKNFLQTDLTYLLFYE